MSEPLAPGYVGGLFGDDVERAIHACFAAHEGQWRKGTSGAPYVTHPYHVALVLARFGASPTVLIGALLHDAVEDSTDWDLARVQREFGDEVCALVDELTEDKSLTWSERKHAWVVGVGGMSEDAVLVKCADKLHNLHSLAVDLEATEDREALWAKFRGGREPTIEHAAKLVEALRSRAPQALGDALARAFARFLAAAGE